MQDYQKYCHEGAGCKDIYFRVGEGVELRVLSYQPAIDTGNVPVMIIGGLATIIDSFGQIILELSRDFPVYFIETRDRSTSRITGEVSYSIETMGHDISEIVRMLNPDDGRYVLMGYSFGSSLIAESYPMLEKRPLCIVFMEPTSAFHYPAWGIFIIRWFGKAFYKTLKPFGKWYLRTFRMNMKEDSEMAHITFKSLDNADPNKLTDTILAIAGYEVWDKLEPVSCPSLVVGTSKDRLHIHEEVMRLVSSLKRCEYIDMENNLRTHSPEMGQVVRTYINSLTQQL